MINWFLSRHNTNFFSAFTALADVPSIYIYALGITPKDPTHPFVVPPVGDVVKILHNIHKRPQSPLHITADDYSLGNLKFIPKGEKDKRYLTMAARKPHQPTAVIDEESVKKKIVQPADKSKKPTPAKQTKHVKEKSTKPSPSTRKPNKKSTMDQYIFQRRTPVIQDASTGPSA
ncbi:hypothetical protein Tco_1322237 [Tanacetum coccineum]